MEDLPRGTAFFSKSKIGRQATNHEQPLTRNLASDKRVEELLRDVVLAHAALHGQHEAVLGQRRLHACAL